METSKPNKIKLSQAHKKRIVAEMVPHIKAITRAGKFNYHSIRMIAHGNVRCGGARALLIERVSGGRVKASTLRPDLFKASKPTVGNAD